MLRSKRKQCLDVWEFLVSLARAWPHENTVYRLTARKFISHGMTAFMAKRQNGSVRGQCGNEFFSGVWTRKWTIGHYLSECSRIRNTKASHRSVETIEGVIFWISCSKHWILENGQRTRTIAGMRTKIGEIHSRSWTAEINFSNN